MNVLKPHVQTTILTLLAAGKSQREIAHITGVDRKTIRSQTQRAEGGISNSPRVATGSNIQIPNSPTPATDFADHVASACEPHRAFITEQLRLRRNYTAIYQDQVEPSTPAAAVRDPLTPVVPTYAVIAVTPTTGASLFSVEVYWGWHRHVRNAVHKIRRRQDYKFI